MKDRIIKHINFFLLILIISFSIDVFSQTSVGISIGSQKTILDSWQYYGPINTSFIQTNDYGIIFQYRTKKKLAYQTEVHYSPKGVLIDSLGDKYTFINNYIEIPCLIKYSLGNESLRLTLAGGPMMSYPFTLTKRSKTYKTKDYYPFLNNSFDLGIALDVGLEYCFDFGVLFADMRLTQGIGSYSYIWNYNSTSFRLSTGFLISFGKSKY